MTSRIICTVAVFPAMLFGQVLLQPGSKVRLLPSDAAVLENEDIRRDMGCSVHANPPELEFDLSYHAAYNVAIPFQELTGNGNTLTAIFRVMPQERPDRTTYFTQKWTVPPIAETAKGIANLRGSIVLGRGTYRIEWLLRDVHERFCTAHWRVVVAPRGRDEQVALRQSDGTASEEPTDPFTIERPVNRDTHPLSALVLLHVASQADGGAWMQHRETIAVASILRSVAREPRIGTFSLVAFNTERKQVLLRNESAREIDFPAVGQAINDPNLRTVDVHSLIHNDSGPPFLRELLSQEIAAGRPDMIVFVGPKTPPEFGLGSVLKGYEDPKCPLFYLTYSTTPNSNPWHDLIGRFVSFWKGVEYTISKPRDIPVAWGDVMSRMANRETTSRGLNRTDTMSGLLPKK